MKRTAYFGGFVAAVLILYFGGVKVVAVIKNMNKPVVVEVVVLDNPAEDILDSGDSFKALKEARAILEKQDHQDHREVLEKVRDAICREVRELLDKEDFNRANLSKASQKIERASNADPNGKFSALQDEVNRECHAYDLVVASIDDAADTAVLEFPQVDGGSHDARLRATVKKGDRVDPNGQVSDTGRFRVSVVGKKFVRFTDAFRDNREFTVSLHGRGR